MNSRILNLKLLKIADQILANPRANNFKCPIDKDSPLNFEIKSHQQFEKLEVFLVCNQCGLQRAITVVTNRD